MRNQKGLLFFFIAMWIIVLPSLAGASTVSQTLTAEGRAVLFNSGNMTYSGMLAANEKFKAAVTDDPADPEANFYYSITRLAALGLTEGQGGGLETVRDLFASFGIERNGNDEFGSEPFDEFTELYGQYDPPDTVPGGAAFQAFFSGPFLAEIEGSLGNLAVPDAAFTVALSGADTGGDAFEIDYGDVLALRTLLLYLKTVIQLASAYDLDVDLREVLVLGNAGAFNLQNLLGRYPGLLALKAGEGSATLTAARTTLMAGIDSFRETLQFITSEGEDQADDFFFFGSAGEEVYAWYILDELTELQISLNENRPAVFTSASESWYLTNDTGEMLSIQLGFNGNGLLIEGTSAANNSCDFIFCSGTVTDYVRTGDQVTLTLEADGFCQGTATLNATISGNQITNGTYTATDCWHTFGAGKSFTGSTFASAPESESFDLNNLFGNAGKTPLDVRAVLPKFSPHNEMVAGTFPGNPVLNGIAVNYLTNNDLAVQMNLRPESAAGSPYFNIPQVADTAITIDGSVADWKALPDTLLFTDATGDHINDWGQSTPGTDIREVYLARDATYLYIGFELDDADPYAYEFSDPTFGDQSSGFTLEVGGYMPSEAYGNIMLNTYYLGGQWNARVQMRNWPWMPPMDIGTTTTAAAAGTKFIEWRVPLSSVNSLSGLWPRAYSHMTGPWGTQMFDNSPAQIKLDTTDVSGNITCGSCSGDGKLFVRVIDGPDPDHARRFVEGYVDTAGGYSLDGIPQNANVYVAVLYDADNNGIKSFGDVWGISGPITTGVGGNTLSVNVTNVIDDSYVMTKPGVYRVFGSNTYMMPQWYWGPWDPHEVAWGADWTFLGEYDDSSVIPADRFYKYILILWNGDREFRFDAIQDLTAGTAFRTDETGNYFGSGWITAGLSNQGDDGWNEPSFFMGFPDSAYARTRKWPGFSIMEMPTDSLNDATPRQIAMTLLPPFTLAANMVNVNSGDSLKTFYMTEIYDYNGSLPGDVDQWTITGPGFSRSYSKSDIAAGKDGLTYYPQFTELFLSVPGSPTPGNYTFSVTVDGVTLETTDIQYVNHTFDIVDISSATPAANQQVTSLTPMFTWPAIDSGGRTVNYRLVINDPTGNRVFATARKPGMLSYTLPVGVLQPGQAYAYRIRVIDSDQWLQVQNRSHTDWIPFTTAAGLTHPSQPAFDEQNFYATTWTTSNGPGLLCSATVTDADGVAADGSSHSVTVKLPDNPTPQQLMFDGAVNGTTAQYYLYIPGTATQDSYLFTVTDPQGGVGNHTDSLIVNELVPATESALRPSLINPKVESITATFDNVVVDGSLYDDFSGYTTSADIPWERWQIGGNGQTSIINGKLQLDSADGVGRHTQIALIPNADNINSIQAEITVTAASSNTLPRARIAGGWFHDGVADVWAGLNVYSDRVTWYANHDHFDETIHWSKLDNGLLKTINPGQSVVASISWDPATKTLTFTADGVSATYTSPAAVIGPPILEKQKGLWTRTNLTTSITPTFTWNSIPGAARYRVRIYNYDKSQTIHKGYVDDGSTTYQVPAGILRPSAFYTYRIEAWDAVNPSEVDNFSKTPASNSMNYQFYTGLPGDMDGSISVELDDAIRVFKAVNGKPVAIGLSGDVNGDDAAGVEDAAFILQKISGVR